MTSFVVIQYEETDEKKNPIHIHPFSGSQLFPYYYYYTKMCGVLLLVLLLYPLW